MNGAGIARTVARTPIQWKGKLVELTTIAQDYHSEGTLKFAAANDQFHNFTSAPQMSASWCVVWPNHQVQRIHRYPIR